MVAYEFSTQLTDNGTVIIPPQYRHTLSKRAPVRVILLVEEEIAAQSDKADLRDEPTLEQVVAKIQQLGPSQTKVTPASGLLGQHLSELMEERDPTFNPAA